VIHGGGRGSGLMIPKPRVKGARGSEDHLCKRNCPMTVPISGYLAASGGGSHLSIGGEMATEKEASVDFFLLIGGREREREWSWSRTSATVIRRLASPAGMQHSTAPLSRVGLACGTVNLKPTQATVPPGWAQIIKPNIFFYFQTDPNL
jgi:hypothetical protein